MNAKLLPLVLENTSPEVLLTYIHQRFMRMGVKLLSRRCAYAMQISSRQTLNILLVEDSPSDARLMGEALRETPLLVKLDVAPDGNEALKYLHRSLSGGEQRPDLILLDLNLPGKNGHEVLAEVKADPDFKQIPVLIMSSSNADSDVAAAYSLNANCYITKPCDLGEYIGVVRAIEDFWFLTATLPDPASRKAAVQEPPARVDAAAKSAVS